MMPVPEFYRGREQTYVKHFFLENYLERVAYNILSFRNEFVYVDGFSGPWRSADEALEDTSFMIALKQLRKVRDAYEERGRKVRIRCIFNEKNPAAYASLKETVDAVEDIDVTALCQEFEAVVPEIVHRIGTAFSLTFIDPTSWVGFDLKKIQPLLALKGEVIINFMLDFANRFFEAPDPANAANFSSLFGGAGWDVRVKELIAAGESREDALLGVYLERLRQVGTYRHVTSTRILKPFVDRSYFYLVYGTRHWKGLVEFRATERSTVDEQESVRGAAKMARRIERTGQHELFAGTEELTGPRSFEDELARQHERGHAELRRVLRERGSVNYEEVLGVVLEMPLVWESEVKTWLREMFSRREIEIPQLTGRQRTPKPGRTIVWRGSTE